MQFNRRFRAWVWMWLAIWLTYAYSVPQIVAEWTTPAFAEDGFLVEVTTEEEKDSLRQENGVETLLQVEVIREAADPKGYEEKRVLIYHTHTYEAYEQTADHPYKKIEKWRTADNDHNVVAVGKALAANLTALGVIVEHETTAYEPPTLDNAYDRSLVMLERRRAAGETYDLYIDLHRDAIASTSTIKRTVNIGGVETARFMVLVGKGTTGGYDEKPNWEANLTIAQKITELLNAQCSGLARDVKIKTGRFNQHIAEGCVLIECGMNTNTLEEVLAGIPYLAQAIAETLTGQAE